MKLNCSIDEIKRLASREVKELLDNDTLGTFQLLDVRQPREYEAGHIPGAVSYTHLTLPTICSV